MKPLGKVKILIVYKSEFNCVIKMQRFLPGASSSLSLRSLVFWGLKLLDFLYYWEFRIDKLSVLF